MRLEKVGRIKRFGENTLYKCGLQKTGKIKFEKQEKRKKNSEESKM